MIYVENGEYRLYTLTQVIVIVQDLKLLLLLLFYLIDKVFIGRMSSYLERQDVFAKDYYGASLFSAKEMHGSRDPS